MLRRKFGRNWRKIKPFESRVRENSKNNLDLLYGTPIFQVAEEPFQELDIEHQSGLSHL